MAPETADVARMASAVDAAAKRSVGVIGLGTMGRPMAECILSGAYLTSGAAIELVVWNRTTEKAEAFASSAESTYGFAVRVAATPAEVVRTCSVVYSMLLDLSASCAVFESAGFLESFGPGKALVDCATLTPDRMVEMATAVSARGGRFLEAPVSGGKGPAATGDLIFMCGGEESLYSDVAMDLDAMGKARFLFGQVGAGTRAKLAVNMTMGSLCASLSEGLLFARETGINQAKLLEVLDLGVMSCALFRAQGPNMLAGEFKWGKLPKDMGYALGIAKHCGLPLPMVSAAAQQADSHGPQPPALHEE
eukprot:SAG31_NODE_2696_length_5228_cov_2.063365_1_plen_307_part_00